MENFIDDQENLRVFLEESELLQYYELFRDILKVSKLSQLKFVAVEDLVQIGFSKPEQRRFKKIYSKFFPNSYLKKLRKFLHLKKKKKTNKHDQIYTPMDFQSGTDINFIAPTKHIISIDDITINKELGMGQFGVVQQGTWATGNQRLQVAIKCLGNERMTSNSTEFLKEAAVMHSIEHPNIVRLYGVVLHLDSLMLVTELAPLRSLLECLQEITLRLNFPVEVLCNFAEQICHGMAYLEKTRLIHRDLAARNILVFNKDRVKISDFGLSRALGAGKNYYQTNYNVNLKLPVAWCAPECILFLRFTSASDVWAFAVCLWEMFTYGFQPWMAFSGQQILEAIDAPNFQRLERPECCPDAYYSLMLECWSHEPSSRPMFKDLEPRLRQIKPDEVQAICNYTKLEDGRRSNFLEYKAGQKITVLGKESYTKSAMWYGVLPCGTCGVFDPNQTKPWVNQERGALIPGSRSPHPIRNSSRSIRSSLMRSDVKRHTYTGKRIIERSMISSPQGDVKHTVHVGLDGAYFGDVSFLDQAGCPPRQIVTPYKPSEDLEQVPLINPNSPSHLTATASTSPYPLLSSNNSKTDCDEVDLSYDDGRATYNKKTHKSILEPSSSKSLFNKVKSATLGRSNKNADSHLKHAEVHEYHEISDTESNVTEMKSDMPPESPGIRGCTDFSQSILEEMESMFKSLDTRIDDEDKIKESEIEAAVRVHTLNKKKGFPGTMKPMSAHDEKTLETAVALANEITSKSMNDLDGEDKPQISPCERDRTKLFFKLPIVSSLHHGTHDTENACGRNERRNFSEEAKSVPDIQATITEESKQAYAKLIEYPTLSSSLLSQINPEHVTGTLTKSIQQVSTIPKPAPRQNLKKQFLSLPKQIVTRDSHDLGFESPNASNEGAPVILNEIPLPPRGTKPKLVDKPRHYRKYPLKIPNPEIVIALPPAPPTIQKPPPVIYQNTISYSMPMNRVEKYRPKIVRPSDAGVDVFDGPEVTKTHTNPFKATTDSNTPGPSSVNPFKFYLEKQNLDQKPIKVKVDDTKCTAECDKASLTKDYVSVEDLLEFADKKPSARQRGVDSDEVRIMNKVLQYEVNPEECLEVLEFSDWNVHIAIKIFKVKIAVRNLAELSLQEYKRELEAADGDVIKAANALIDLYTLANKKIN